MTASRRIPARTLALLLACVAALSACALTDSPDAPERGEHASPAGPEWNTSPSSIAAIGDSLTTAFHACEVLSDCPETSWATGSDSTVPSLAQLLPAESAWNEAVSGSKIADLPGQAQRAVTYRPELVTVLIGANDACTREKEAMTETEDFRADFTEALQVIRSSLPDSQVYVASVPDLMQLWEVGREHPEARQVWQFGICQSMLRNPLADTPEAIERRETVRERVQSYNAVLAEVCGEDPLCRYDDGAVFGYPFSAGELSEWDWFHPSREGQRILAGLAHQEITRD
ncbi:GDSL-type esterase/lipase family protein [Streptomyces sp. ACA25]|uniref:GDSL-type esterase/lipase family protein n=1 Tax=Streptomyces sp. ACA25 TaxID=3022596 RepID=UPI0023078FA7|nr:GDSL-type esterase/lipase family protein [Streptomyces sp. ACA25]MDB1087740.1 GDSL-type esterase/lipase family protein [Streptomyces sp. ACA25]